MPLDGSRAGTVGIFGGRSVAWRAHQLLLQDGPKAGSNGMCTCRVAVASAAVAAVETGAAAAVGVERLSDCFAVGALGASFGTDACAHAGASMGPNLRNNM